MKCAKCHKPLDPRAKHFHHIKGWADGGPTLIKNGAAVCPTCHSIIGNKERVKKAEARSKTKAKAKPKTKAKSTKKRTTRRRSPDPFGVGEIKVPRISVPSIKVPKW